MSVCSGSLGFTSPIWFLNVHSECFSGSIDTLIRGPYCCYTCRIITSRFLHPEKTIVNENCCLTGWLSESVMRLPARCTSIEVTAFNAQSSARHLVDVAAFLWTHDHVSITWLVPGRLLRIAGPLASIQSETVLVPSFSSFWPMAIPFITAHDVCLFAFNAFT